MSLGTYFTYFLSPCALVGTNWVLITDWATLPLTQELWNKPLVLACAV